MIFFVIFSTIVPILVAVFIWLYIDRKRYTTFIENNSVSLRALKEINADFTFFPRVSFDQRHTYDNENFYEEISCEDHLIYMLQFDGKKICEQIEKINRNRVEYRRYIDRIEKLQPGNFIAPTRKLNQKKLLKLEKKLCRAAKLPAPATEFSIKVKLYCATMRGATYASKSEIFSAEQILMLIKRLKNKSGHFFRDRGIWDAICRVERGKVSNEMRFSIYKRDGYRCRNCGVSQRDARLEIDHIIPISKGGKSTYDNLQTLCHKCNVEKGNKF